MSTRNITRSLKGQYYDGNILELTAERYSGQVTQWTLNFLPGNNIDHFPPGNNRKTAI